MVLERVDVRGFIALTGILLFFLGLSACATAQQQGGGSSSSI
jgi:hypothetical protein